jgi:hypothetical protein
MEDHLHVHRIRAKQWLNNRQYLIQTVHADTRNRTEIGVDRALTWTGTPDPGVEVRTNFLRQRGWRVRTENPQLRGRASETTLSHVHSHSSFYPFSSEYSFMTKYRKFKIYIEIWHIGKLVLVPRMKFELVRKLVFSSVQFLIILHLDWSHLRGNLADTTTRD